MANSLGTISAAVIAQESLPLLIAKIPLLKNITTEFGNDVVYFNQQVKTRILGGGTVSNYDPVNGYVVSDVSDTDVTLTINQQPQITIGFNDQELSSTPFNLIGEHSEVLANKMAASIMTTICGEFINADFGAGAQTTTVTNANATRATVISAGNLALDLRNVGSDRFAILNPNYYYGLMNDPTLIYLTAGALGVQSPVLPVIEGVSVAKYNSLPSESQNLAGVMGAKDSLIFASRVPAVPVAGVPQVANITNVTDPDSGLTMQVREWYDPQKGKLFVTYTLMYGVAVGNPNSLQLFVTA